MWGLSKTYQYIPGQNITNSHFCDIFDKIDFPLDKKRQYFKSCFIEEDTYFIVNVGNNITEGVTVEY